MLPNRKKVLLIFSGIVILLLLITALIFSKRQNQNNLPSTINTQPNVSQKPQKIAAKVQNDNIYDFQVEDIEKQTKIKDANTITASLIKESLIFQQAEKEKLIALPTYFFTQEYKQSRNYSQDKNRLLRQIKEAYQKKSAWISGGIVTVFFYNQKFASIPFDQADMVAYQYISETKDKILSKEWTTDQAIAALTKKDQMALLDFNYLNNTGLIFNKEIIYDTFKDPEYISVVKSFSTGSEFQVSNIYRSPGTKEQYGMDFFEKNPDTNGFYYFIVKTDKGDGYYESFDDWKSKLGK